MLREIPHVRQIEEEGFRRWFSDEFFDLIVWYDDSKTLKGFQLCYGKEGVEKVLTWKKHKGYSHDNIDDGEVPGRHKKTPILTKDGVFRGDLIAKKFLEAAGEMEHDLVEFIHDKILACH